MLINLPVLLSYKMFSMLPWFTLKGLSKKFQTRLGDDIKSCEKNSMLNSFKIRGREGFRPDCHV